LEYRNIEITIKELNDDSEWSYINYFKHELDDIKAVIVIFDVTNENSFNLAKTFINYVQTNTSVFLQIFLLGNKCDLEMEAIISTRDVFDFLKNKECINYIECSCKTETNIEKFFNVLEDTLTNECINGKFRVIQNENSGSCYII